MAWQHVMTTATRGHQALPAAEQARAAVPMTRRAVRGRRRAVGRTIVAYRRGDGAATNYEIARVTVTLQHLKAKDDSRTRTDRPRCHSQQQVPGKKYECGPCDTSHNAATGRTAQAVAKAAACRPAVQPKMASRMTAVATETE